MIINKLNEKDFFFNDYKTLFTRNMTHDEGNRTSSVHADTTTEGGSRSESAPHPPGLYQALLSDQGPVKPHTRSLA